MSDETKINGRPTDYSEELAREICESISVTSKGLLRLCENNPHWPTYRTIRNWIRDNKSFFHLYAQAKLDQADLLVEECLDISDDSTNDTIIDDNGNSRCDSEWVQRSRLRVDTRKWVASKLAPKMYGERIQQEHTGKDGSAILVVTDSRNRKIEDDLANLVTQSNAETVNAS